VWSRCPPVVLPSFASPHPSNGALTTVKTCQDRRLCGAVSSSAPSQEPVSQWLGVGLNTEPPTAQQLAAMSHLPFSNGLMASFARGKGKDRGKKGRGKRGSHERSTALGNDTKPPWLYVTPSRRELFRSVEGTLSSLFFNSSTTVPVYASNFFTFASVADSAALANVFDQYMIHTIEVLVEPQVSEITGPASDVGEYITVVDIDDATVPTAASDLQAYPTQIQTRGTSSHYHRWSPGVAYAVYSGAFTSYGSTQNTWIDCNSPSVQHYGIKAVSFGATVAQAYLFQARYHMMFRARH